MDHQPAAGSAVLFFAGLLSPMLVASLHARQPLDAIRVVKRS